MIQIDIEQLFRKFQDLKVLIIGDVMIDSYIWGKVSRISPEAPVPVVDVTGREHRLGGAANVAKNIKALGATPVLCSIIGTDDKASILKELMQHQALELTGLVETGNRITTTKFRVIGNYSQLLRVDEEMTHDISEEQARLLLVKIFHILEHEPIDVIVFEDYNKGLLTEDVIQSVIEKARQLNIPVAVDPKKKNFTAYKRASLFKPNLKEIREGLNLSVDATDANSLRQAVQAIHQTMEIDLVMTTLSEHGICISQASTGFFVLIPAHKRDIVDVSGAGDTVVSVAALCLAAGVPAAGIAELANIAGGIVCEKPGVTTIEKDILLKECIQLS